MPIKFKRNIEKLSLKQLREDIETIITTVRSKLKMLDSERLFVNVIAVENIFYTYPINDMVSLLSLHLITCKTSKSITFINPSTNIEPLKDIFIENSTYYLKVIFIGNCSVVYGIKPCTGLVVPCIASKLEGNKKKIYVCFEPIN